MSVPSTAVLAASLTSVHRDFSWVVVLANALVGLWALAAHRWPAVRRKGLWVAVVLAQLTVFAQVVLGVVLQNQEESADPGDLHRLYGFAAIAAVAILYAYRAQLGESRRYLLYGGGGLFLMGLGIRAMILT